MVCSLHSWGSGADLWGSDSDNRFEKPRIDDGLLEVVGVTGVVHMVSWHPRKNRGNTDWCVFVTAVHCTCIVLKSTQLC